jgi:nucleoside-triphosphatase THEP1
MNRRPLIATDPLVYYRLVALWAMIEATLGGIIHGLKIPVSGLFIGGAAVLCICLLAWYVPKRGALLKATLIVAIFKMMMSPQAPAPAYFAVFFQGLLGEVLFYKRSWFRFSCFVLAILALFESGLQRIVVLTLVYGTDVWKAINTFINGLTGESRVTNYSFWLVSGYLFLHLVAGLMVGWIASRLPAWVSEWRRSGVYTLPVNAPVKDLAGPAPKKKRWLKKGVLVIWIILLTLYLQSVFNFGNPLLPSHIALRILVRSIIIIIAWIFFVGPLVTSWLQKWLRKKQVQSGEEVNRILQLLPATQQLLSGSWNQSSRKKGWRRIREFARYTLVNALYPVSGRNVYILTGPVQTGKTSSLLRWTENREDIQGVLTPIVNEKRMFFQLGKRQLFAMEAETGDPDAIPVGKYQFDKESFERAIRGIRDVAGEGGWLVIDEIGPLELREEGFYSVLMEILANPVPGQHLLLVCRDGMVQNAIEKFHLQEPVIITSVEALP